MDGMDGEEQFTPEAPGGTEVQEPVSDGFSFGGETFTADQFRAMREAHSREAEVRQYEEQLKGFAGTLEERAREHEETKKFLEAYSRDPAGTVRRLAEHARLDPATLQPVQVDPMQALAEELTGIKKYLGEQHRRLEETRASDEQDRQLKAVTSAFDGLFGNHFKGWGEGAMQALKDTAYAYRFPGRLKDGEALERAKANVLHLVMHPEDLPPEIRAAAEKVWLTNYQKGAGARATSTAAHLSGTGGAKGPKQGLPTPGPGRNAMDLIDEVTKGLMEQGM